MRLILVQRKVGDPTLEQIERNPQGHVEPVAIIVVNTELTDAEMNELGQSVLAIIGDKPVNTEELRDFYSMFMG